MSIIGIIHSDAVQTYKLFRMNLKNRYLGSRFGLAWSVLQPLIMMIMYIVVFGFIFKIKIAGSDNPMDYVIWFICGFAPWMAINEGIALSTSAIISGISIIKNFTIKAELIPMSYAVMGIPQMAVGLVIVLILSIATGFGISFYVIELIIVIPVVFILLMGIGFWVSATAVFNRDIAQVIPTILQLIFYFTPIFYDINQFPWIIQKLTFFNPVYQICAPFRAVLFEHTNIDIWGFIYLILLTAIIWILGLKYFHKLQGYFESAL